MIWKTVLITLFAVGAWAAIEITEEQQNKAKNAIRELCKQNNAEDKTDEVQGKVVAFGECVKTLFDPETLKNEIEEAKPNGALDEVFKKYCAKSPELKTCIHDLTDGVTPCLQESLRSQIPNSVNATDSLIDFVCYKDGDRIALFIAEGGPECFVEKRSEIQTCAEKLSESVSTIEAAKALTIAEQCAKFNELSTCVVTALEGCSSPTPSNMAESLLRYMRKGSVCDKKD